MGLTNRRAARTGALSQEDHELQAHLADAKASLERALSVCRKVSSMPVVARVGASAEEVAQAEELRLMAGRSRQNMALLHGILSQMGQVTDLKSKLAQDIDLLSEEVRAAMSRDRKDDSRESRLDRRVKAEAKKRQKATEVAVQNVLASLGANR